MKRQEISAVGPHFAGSGFAAWTKRVIYLVVGAVCAASICPGSLAGNKPPDWDKTLEKGVYQLSIGNTKEAAEFFEGKVKKYPDSGACHTQLGKALKRLGKFSEAKAEFRKATEVEPTYADGFYELGSLLEGDRDFSGAAQAFERFLQLKPDAADRQTITDRIRECRNH
jgi:tetratricopeptide (TPR) repeat protein